MSDSNIAVVRSASPGCLPTWSYANMDGCSAEEIKTAFEAYGEHVYSVCFCTEEEAQELVYND